MRKCANAQKKRNVNKIKRKKKRNKRKKKNKITKEKNIFNFYFHMALHMVKCAKVRKMRI